MEPETSTPETSPPETSTPETSTPETSPPESSTPETSPPESSTPAWNGELSSLTEAEWYSALDPSVQELVKSGYESKLKSYDSGYQAKYRTLAEERKAFQAEQEQLKAERKAIEEMLYGGEDPTVKVKEEYEAKLQELTGSRDALQQQLEEQRAQLEAHAVDSLMAHLEAQAPQVLQDDAAFERVCKLLEAGIDAGEAIQMSLALIPNEDPTPSKGVAAASPTSKAGHARRGSEGSYEDVRRRILQGQ